MCSSQKSIWMWTLVPLQTLLFHYQSDFRATIVSRNNIKIERSMRVKKTKIPRLSHVILWHNSIRIFICQIQALILFFYAADHFSKSSTGVSFFPCFVHNNFCRKEWKDYGERGWKGIIMIIPKTIISDRLFVFEIMYILTFWRDKIDDILTKWFSHERRRVTTPWNCYFFIKKH